MDGVTTLFGLPLGEFVGVIAAVLTTAAFLPQAVKVIRERETAGISLAMYAIFTTGVFLWLCYGLTIASIPVIAANAVTFLLAGTILATKLRYG